MNPILNIGEDLSQRTHDFEHSESVFRAKGSIGVFCLPSCSVDHPSDKKVEYFPGLKDALSEGFRPCAICKPLENQDGLPDSIKRLFRELTDNYSLIKDSDLQLLDLDPTEIKKWFKINYQISFRDFQRMLHLNIASNKLLKVGQENSKLLCKYFTTHQNLFSPSKKSILYLKEMRTPLGMMVAAATEAGICLLEFSDRISLHKSIEELLKKTRASVVGGEHHHFSQLEDELRDYFAGERQQFSIPLAPVGSQFQGEVWEALSKIPYGETRTYRQQSELLGNAKKVRAVANANGLNKISILIPCHRVIGSNGTLTGYGGGVWRKKKLLDLEKKSVRESS